MKKFFLFLVLPFMSFGQGEPKHGGELMIDLINFGSSWDVTFDVTAVSEKWDENYYLTSDYDNATTTIEDPQIRAYFDLIIDIIAGNNPIIALGKYKISAIENEVEQAYFYMDYRTYFDPYHPSVDVYFKYDITNKRFRNHSDTQTIDGTTQTIWDLVSGIDLVTSGLELYLTVSNQNDTPYLEWNEYHDTNIDGYNVYRKVTTSS